MLWEEVKYELYRQLTFLDISVREKAKNDFDLIVSKIKKLEELEN